MKIGSLFAATLAKASEADVLLFSDNAKYMAINKRDSTLTVADRLARNAKFAGTNFHCVFETANRAYDRIIFLSDMQGWIGHDAPVKTFQAYKKKYRQIHGSSHSICKGMGRYSSQSGTSIAWSAFPIRPWTH